MTTIQMPDYVIGRLMSGALRRMVVPRSAGILGVRDVVELAGKGKRCRYTVTSEQPFLIQLKTMSFSALIHWDQDRGAREIAREYGFGDDVAAFREWIRRHFGLPLAGQLVTGHVSAAGRRAEG
jgi:hypothetical protein